METINPAQKHQLEELNLERIAKNRISDYLRADPRKNRDRLLELWKEAYPNAAAEQSEEFQPLILHSKRRADEDPSAPDEIWMSPKYNVTLRRRPDPVFKTGLMIQLGISAWDGTAVHDWRDFQAIKNQLAGEECEAFELYPAESRLLDPSNYYSLWCFPKLNRIRVGMEQRNVFDRAEAMAPQRALARRDTGPVAIPEAQLIRPDPGA